jgi:hypothetical protein
MKDEKGSNNKPNEEHLRGTKSKGKREIYKHKRSENDRTDIVALQYYKE